MKYLALLVLLVGCNRTGGYDKDGAEDYLTNSYLCDTIHETNYGTTVYDCENIMTGTKVDKIINPSNVHVVKE